MQENKFKRLTLHEQVAEELRRLMLTDFRPGQKIESERKLARRFDVSVSTIREAITTFVHEGLIERRAGRGTVVKDRGTPTQHVALVVGMDWPCSYSTYFAGRLFTQTMSGLRQQAGAGRPY